VVITQVTSGAEEVVRPASSAEVELWNALTRRFAAPSRESYIRVNEQDLVSVLMERDHLRKQVTELQKKHAELASDAEAAKHAPEPSHDGQEREPHEAADDRGPA